MTKDKYINTGILKSYTSGGLMLLLLTILHTSLFSQHNNLQHLHYTINAKLDDRQHSLNGFLTINYKNISPDTLQYIWMQLWPNALKNDRTAYSEKMLDEGSNDFYFSGREQKGYINRIVLRSGGEVLAQEDHPQYIDIIKVYLLRPLYPGRSVEISTPFHLQLPYDFSGFGYANHIYRLQNWYPAVAPFDATGWHPKPFTGQQQEATADYDVSISIPRKYIVSAINPPVDSTFADTIKSVRYHADNVNDFSWSAKIPGAKYPVKKITFDQRMDRLALKILSQKWLPAIGYNVYDGFQLGIFHHSKINYNETPFFFAPMLGTASKGITGYAGLNLNVAPGKYFKKITVGINGSRFSDLKGTDSLGHRITGDFYKIAPFVRVGLPNKNKHNEDWLEFKTYIVGEKEFDFVKYSVDSFYYPAIGKTKTRYLNQLTFSHTSHRSLYPYDAQLQIQQANNFYRINGEAHYFFNYPAGGGLQTRIFAAKFGYIGTPSPADTYRYQPKLTAVRGEEDYTYDNAFIGRNEFTGFSSQQIMLRDGGLKLRTDMFQDLQGRSDNWVASMNFNTTLPSNIFPVGFPLRLFFDVGTYAGAWQKNSSLPRFLYVSGLQLSLLKNSVNIYAPVLYSNEFRDNLKTVPEENGFFKKISFSLDLTRFTGVFTHKS